MGNPENKLWIDQWQSPIGILSIACREKELVSLHIGNLSAELFQEELLKQGFCPILQKNRLTEQTRLELMEYFAGNRLVFHIPLAFRGTPFQVTVWKTLCQVPYGKTITYSELAERSYHPNASRAAGTAMAKNHIPILIPCHRVIAAGNKLGGYSGGLDVKIKLLELEKLR